MNNSEPAARGFRKRLTTVLVAFRHQGHDLVHLLGREQRTEGPALSRLAATFPAGGCSPVLRGYLRWV
jgi:hypothetical protein